MNKIQNINKKTIVYYLVIITIASFLFSENIFFGPFQPISDFVDQIKVKYILMISSAFLFLLLIIIRRKKLFKNGVFKKEAKLYLLAIGSLIVITAIFQIMNGFRTFAISEFMYLLLPLGFVILVVSVDYFNITRILDNCFYVVVAIFLLGNIAMLNPSSVMSISFSSSTSPFENGSSMLFVLFELYYLIRYGKRNGKSLVCLILTVLTLKRISVIMAILFFIFAPMIKDKKIPRWIFWLTIVFFCAVPFALEFFYSSSFSNLFLATFGIDFNDFTMDRFTRTAYVFANSDQIKFGYGSVTYFLTNHYGKGDFANRSLHSDLLRIYLECTFVGTFIYNICYFLSVKKDSISYLLLVTIFLQMIFNHPIGAGTVGHWIIIYLMIVYFNYRKEVPFYKEGLISRRKMKLGKLEI
ncbi:MAG TPA: hypothetical protein DCL29_02700 [Eubacterium sp.]|nr:hypothetical protein [Eubacterium sp.]